MNHQIPPLPMPSHVLVDFVVFPPGHGRSVTDFWGWDAPEARLRCPDDVSGDIGVCSVRRALKPKFYPPTQTMVRENSHGRTGNRTRDLTISSQRLWPLDHEAGLHVWMYVTCYEGLTDYSIVFWYTHTESTTLCCNKHPKATHSFKVKYFPNMETF